MWRAFWRTILGVALVVALVGVFVHYFQWNWLREPAGTLASRALGRDFAIDGDLSIELDWVARVRATGVRLGSPAWSKEANMAEVEGVDLLIDLRELIQGRIVLPEITLSRPRLLLEKAAANRKNWELGNSIPAADEPEAGKGPVIGRLTIHDGLVNYRDVPGRMTFRSTVATLDDPRGRGEQRLRLDGRGTVEGQTFTLRADTGSVLALREPGQPFPLRFELRAGPTVFAAQGTVTDPARLAGIDARLNVQGNNLADIFPFTGIPLPPTAPYRIVGRLTKQGALWSFEQFKGQVGGSDLGGDLRYEARGERGFVAADLASKTLKFEDLAGFIGAPPGKPRETKAGDGRVLPDMPLDLERLRAADLDIGLRAERIEAPDLPLERLNARFRLVQGLLIIDPLVVGIAAGKIEGRLALDGRDEVPVVDANLGARELNLQHFFTSSRFEPLSQGRFGGHAAISGRGRSLAEVLAKSSGRMSMSMEGGRVSQLMVEAAGLELSNLALTWLGGDKPVELRCAIGDFRVQHGLLDANLLVIDTAPSNIVGTGVIDFATERIDMRFLARPKKPSVVVARTPISVQGPLNGPAVKLEASGLLSRGTAATLLGLLLTPFAALIPFIEPGTGKDTDCPSLVQLAQAGEMP